MRRCIIAAAVVLVAGSAMAFTNAYEPRVLQPAGVADDTGLQFLWAGASLRVDGPGIICGEMRLKVWSEDGGRGQVLLCVNLRPNDAHPKPRQMVLHQARLMPLCTLFDGRLPRHGEAQARRVKFRFRVWLPQPVRAHDLWLVAVRAADPRDAADYIRHREYRGREPLNARAFARLFLWDGANEYTDPYADGYPGWPELFEPQFPAREQ